MPISTTTTEVVGATADQVQTIVNNFSWEKAFNVALMIGISMLLIRSLVAVVGRALDRGGLDRGAEAFLRSGVQIILWLVAICLILGYLGVEANSLVAILSVLGLAVTLAVQNSLSNLAGGIILLTARPFVSGDWVEAGGVSGTVREVGLAYTKLNTLDNKVVYVPNGDISSKTIINYSAEEKRQVVLPISTSYNSPVETVKNAINRVIGEHPLTLPTPAPFVRVKEYNDSCITYTVRCWCATSDYWTVYYDLNEQIKVAFDQCGVEMTYPHMNVHIVDQVAPVQQNPS